MHEARPGYYVFRHPVTKKNITLGYMPIEQAIFEVSEANAELAKQAETPKRLVERMNEGNETIADLLAKMPNDDVKASTIRARKYYDKAILDELGKVRCRDLTTKNVADVLEKIQARGAMQWSVHIRSRLRSVCRRGMALGWMDKNPADATDKAKVKVKRKRMSLEIFKATLAKAPEVADWLPNAMLLALVSGQDLSTVGRWERTAQEKGFAVLTRGKTGVRIAIPLAIRLNAVGLSLSDVIAQCRNTGVVSKYLIHHVQGNVSAPKGSPIKLKTISRKFLEARRLAGYTDENDPTWHEIRSLAKRLYDEQGGVDTKALLGHMSDATANLYANSRGLEPIKVRVAGV